MNKSQIKINFDELFKNRIENCKFTESNPEIKDYLRYRKYFWYEITSDEEPGLSEPVIVIFNVHPGNSLNGVMTTFSGENINFISGKTIQTEDSHIITENIIKVGLRDIPMSVWWDKCVVNYLARINSVQNANGYYKKLILTDPKFVRKLHVAVRDVKPYNV